MLHVQKFGTLYMQLNPKILAKNKSMTNSATVLDSQSVTLLCAGNPYNAMQSSYHINEIALKCWEPSLCICK